MPSNILFRIRSKYGRSGSFYKTLLAGMIMMLGLSSCGEQYCLRCIDPRFGDLIEGCNKDRTQVELAVEEWEQIGYTCVILDPP